MFQHRQIERRLLALRTPFAAIEGDYLDFRALEWRQILDHVDRVQPALSGYDRQNQMIDRAQPTLPHRPGREFGKYLLSPQSPPTRQVPIHLASVVMSPPRRADPWQAM